jgi:hypothetical protein
MSATSAAFGLEAPLPPESFRGRDSAVDQIRQRLLDGLRLSTSVVGGPKTGKTSLLRYLASPYADSLLPSLQCRVYVDAQSLSSTSKPSDFWLRVFRGLRDRAPATVVTALDQRLNGPGNRTIDTYDLEDVFDSFGKEKTSAVVFVDRWEILVKNQNYWGDFFHSVRSLSQREPRGAAFVVGTPRRLLDMWADQLGSVYYNVFASVYLGRMKESEIRRYVQEILKTHNQTANAAAAEGIVLAASDQHPYLVALVTGWIVGQLASNQGQIDQSAIGAALQDPQGKVVELIRQIRMELTNSERQWIDNLRSSPQQVPHLQREALKRLGDYGMLPPGVAP